MSFKSPEHPMRVALVALVVLIGVNVAIWGGRSQVNGAAQKQRPVEIQQLFPNEGDLITAQGEVGADLRDQFTGQLTIDGRLIPSDQTTAGSPLGVVTFDPGPGKEFTFFKPGAHSAVIEWWPKTITTPENARKQQQLRSYSWAFNVD